MASKFVRKTERKRTTESKAETLRRREIRRFKYQGTPLIGRTEK